MVFELLEGAQKSWLKARRTKPVAQNSFGGTLNDGIELIVKPQPPPPDRLGHYQKFGDCSSFRSGTCLRSACKTPNCLAIVLWGQAGFTLWNNRRPGRRGLVLTQ
jgi:hypothetical protein